MEHLPRAKVPAKSWATFQTRRKTQSQLCRSNETRFVGSAAHVSSRIQEQWFIDAYPSCTRAPIGVGIGVSSTYSGLIVAFVARFILGFHGPDGGA